MGRLTRNTGSRGASNSALQVPRRPRRSTTGEIDPSLRMTKIVDDELSQNPRVKNWARDTEGLFAGGGLESVGLQHLVPSSSQRSGSQNEENRLPTRRQSSPLPRVSPLTTSKLCSECSRSLGTGFDGRLTAPHGRILGTTREGQILGGLMRDKCEAERKTESITAQLNFERQFNRDTIARLETTIHRFQQGLQCLREQLDSIEAADGIFQASDTDDHRSINHTRIPLTAAEAPDSPDSQITAIGSETADSPSRK